MKKLIIASVLAITVITSAFASKETLNFKGADKFVAAYPTALKVNYKVTKDYTEVNFIADGDVMQSFYSADGNLIATSRHIALRTLPVKALDKIQQKYEGYTITEAIELQHEDSGLNYYVSLAGKDRKVILEITPSGNVSVFKSEKK